MWARAAWAAIASLLLIGSLSERAVAQMSGIDLGFFVEIAKGGVVGCAQRPVDETTRDGQNFLARNDADCDLRLSSVPDTFRGGINVQLESTKSAGREYYIGHRIVDGGAETQAFPILDIAGGRPISPLLFAIDLYGKTWVHRRRLSAGIGVINHSLYGAVRYDVCERCIIRANPSSCIRNIGVFVQLISRKRGISNSIGGRYALVDLSRRGSQLDPLQIGRNCSSDGGEHNYNSRYGEDAIRSSTIRDPVPAVTGHAPTKQDGANNIRDNFFGVLACLSGAFFCALAIALVIGGVHELALALAATGSAVTAVYLIAHGIILLSLGQWAIP